jgi:hypothetical protein
LIESTSVLICAPSVPFHSRCHERNRHPAAPSVEEAVRCIRRRGEASHHLHPIPVQPAQQLRSPTGERDGEGWRERKPIACSCFSRTFLYAITSTMPHIIRHTPHTTHPHTTHNTPHTHTPTHPHTHTPTHPHTHTPTHPHTHTPTQPHNHTGIVVGIGDPGGSGSLQARGS